MNGMIGWLVAAIILIGAGVYFYSNNGSMSSTDTASTTTQEQAGGTSQQAGENQLAGTWKSDSDAKFTREIRADGVIIDRYEGDATAGINGSWTLVNPEQESILSDRAASLVGKNVVRAEWEGGVEVTYFVVSVDGNKMTTTDLTGRGAVTTYTKVQ